METLEQIMSNDKENRSIILKRIFCERLKELRKAQNLLQKDIANKMGIPESTYSNWEQGRTEPSIYDIFGIIWALGIEANELFDVSGLA